MDQGWGERRYSDDTAHAIDRAVQGIVEDAFKRTVSILTEHRPLLERGAPGFSWKRRRLMRPNSRSFAASCRLVCTSSKLRRLPQL
jgi:hypothetical protein